MKKILILIFTLVFGVMHATSSSLIVPCCAGHFQYLEELCDAVCDQTELPDEVVISLSEAYKIDPIKLDDFRKKIYPFPVNIITADQVLFAGQNRNVACSHAKGDIFICQDADDLLHPQRIEIVKRFFETKQIALLLHRWVSTHKSDICSHHYFFQDTPFYNIRKYNEHGVFDYIHYGNVCLRREVFDHVKWTGMKKAQDKRFLEDAMKNGFSLGMIDAFLLIYRVEYSSWN